VKTLYTSISFPKYQFNEAIIRNYEATRNYPALDQTSRTGSHLRFGTLSVRKMAVEANREENITFLKELIWREFFMQILWHFPHTQKKCFKPQYEQIEWRNNEEEFKKWCSGNTGYPFVDAGMRELNATGFMHNRVRMLVGSFLCKHLLIDWRWGEAYFAEKLLDYEMSSNVGNWQWVAGTGADSQPYFRIFNPWSQGETHDPDCVYIKKWIPELQDIPSKDIHNWEEVCYDYLKNKKINYFKPIVNYSDQRERALNMYKKALE